MCNHSPKFQSLKSLCIKVMFFPKYGPNGFHGIGGKLAYILQNCQLLEHIFLWVFHWFFTVPYSLSFWIQSKIVFWWSMTTLKLSLKTCLHLWPCHLSLVTCTYHLLVTLYWIKMFSNSLRLKFALKFTWYCSSMVVINFLHEMQNFSILHCTWNWLQVNMLCLFP